MLKIAEMVGLHCHIEGLGKSVQCIEITEKVGSVMTKIFQVTFLTALSLDPGNAKQFIMYTALKLAEVNGGVFLH